MQELSDVLIVLHERILWFGWLAVMETHPTLNKDHLQLRQEYVEVIEEAARRLSGPADTQVL